MGVFTSLVDIQLPEIEWQVFKNQVLAEFGSPMVNVELSDEILQSCIVKAMHYVNLYAPAIVWHNMTLTPGVVEYVLPYERVKAVVDLYIHKTFFLMSGYPMDGLYFQELSISQGATGAANFLVDYLDQKTARVIFGFNKMNLELLPPNTVRILPQLTMQASSILKLTTPHVNTLETLDQFEANWVIRYSAALAGRILARIRNKYDNVGLPIGTLAGDAGSILQESIEKENLLINEIKFYGKKVIPEMILLKR